MRSDLYFLSANPDVARFHVLLPLYHDVALDTDFEARANLHGETEESSSRGGLGIYEGKELLKESYTVAGFGDLGH